MENKNVEKRIIGKYFMEEFIVQAWEEEMEGTKKLELMFFGLCDAKKKHPILNIYEQEGEVEITLNYGDSCAYWFLPFSEKKYDVDFSENYRHGLNIEVFYGTITKWESQVYNAEIVINANFD